ncbi:DUF1634 domain-containing protein [Flavobacterium kingsejongi]|uniref:DUF1634 domain-containing protein n=1 Tax=Flavobacterium kingsejongi TaxID=1678728 RepID=A0A2S1LS80_9FLAO|nr:DUF1634 domain-containing protein [Flavobacterium kingsejongi]AWG26521.1 hypothetical protein FK004_15460 [Flavobacterium kingsejongi]
MKNGLTKKLLNDHDIEQLVGQLLRYGVLTASTIAFIGGVAYLIQHGGNTLPHYDKFVGERVADITVKGILQGAMALQATEIIQLGVLVLIATPILRIICSLFAFILEKDRMYVVITLIVLCIMLTSIFGGLKG